MPGSAFFCFDDGLREIDADSIRPGSLSAGYVCREDAEAVCTRLGFAASTIGLLQLPNVRFRSGVEVYDDYTFTELRIVNSGLPPAEDDCVALYIKSDLLLVVDVDDHDGSTRQKFFAALRRYPAAAVTAEKLIFAFLDSLLSGESRFLEETGMQMTEMEEEVFGGKVGKDFPSELLERKKLLMKRHNFYEQLLDITETLDEDENEIFAADPLMYINNLTQKIKRLREDCDSLSNMLMHLQDAHASQLDLQLNYTMKIFTVITSVFFPLTLIVGWYGMNFTNMPELTWRYGYLYVIVLSAATVLLLTLIGKRKKWF